MIHSHKRTEIEYLKNVWKTKIKAKNNLQKLEKDREIECKKSFWNKKRRKQRNRRKSS